MIPSQLAPAIRIPPKSILYFRYDPAVLILSLKWHQTATPFADQLEAHLRQRYVGHEGLVSTRPICVKPVMNAVSTQIMGMELSLETSFAAQLEEAERLADEEAARHRKGGKKRVPTPAAEAEVEAGEGTARARLDRLSGDLEEALHFLKVHETAKMVVVVDTHCGDNGFPMFTGSDPTSYQACSLFEVSFSTV